MSSSFARPVAATSAFADEQPRLSLFARHKLKPSGTGFEFVLNKPKGQALYFIGYSESSPTYKLQVREGDAWTDYRQGICGTGLDIQQIPEDPGYISFYVYPPFTGKVFRVGLRLYQARPAFPEHTPEPTIVWSEEIKS